MRRLLLLILVLALASCDSRTPPVTIRATIAPPTGRVTLIQRLHFAKEKTTFQGMGFLVRSPKGTVFGATAAHFIDRDGPKLLSLDFLGGDYKLVARSTRSVGFPGNEGIVTKTQVDLRMDYLFLWLDDEPDVEAKHLEVLTLDHRPSIPEGEPVWLPFMNDQEPELPERLVTGRVTASDPTVTMVELDEDLQLIGHSGSPVISRRTGQVIGTLSRGGGDNGKSFLLLAPSHAILDALSSAERVDSKPRLWENIGK